MIYLVFLIVLGFATASFQDEVLENAVHEAVMEFMLGMEDVPSLKEYLGVEGAAYDGIDDSIKTELGKALKEKLDEILQKIKDIVEQGKEIKDELKEKIAEKLKDFGIDASKTIKDLIKRLREETKDRLREKLTPSKRDLGEHLETLRTIFDIRGILRKIRDVIMEKISVDKIHEHIEKIRELIKSFLPENSMITKLLLNKLDEGIDKVKALIDLLLGNGDIDERTIRSLNALKGKINELDKISHAELAKRFEKSAEWVKDIWSAGEGRVIAKLSNIITSAEEQVF